MSDGYRHSFYSRGYQDRLGGMREPACPDDFDYMSGWFARLSAEVWGKTKFMNQRIRIALNLLIVEWDDVCDRLGHPEYKGRTPL